MLIATKRNLIASLLTLMVGLTTRMAIGQQTTDILIIGGGTGGTAAAIQAARMGAHVTILEKSEWLGGMLTAAGVSAVDGNHGLPSGIWGEFREQLRKHYGGAKAVATGWVSHTLFEPSVGDSIFKTLASDPLIDLHYNASLKAVERINERWAITYEQNGATKEIYTKMVIDATERGDLLPLVGAKFRLGMDSKNDTNESEAPLLANSIVQDLTYTAILKDVGSGKGKKGLVKKPKGYDSKKYACACKREGGNMFGAVDDCTQMLNYAKLPNQKYLINWPHCGNDYFLDWPQMGEEEIKKGEANAKEFTLGFVYYIQNELGYKNLRLFKEFGTKDDMPIIPYDRESRRIHGKVFLTADYLENPYDHQLYRTGIAVGDYPIDHHHAKNPYAPKIEFINIKIPSYSIPLGCLVPDSIPDFLVAEKNISVSNIVNGTTRLQPVVLGIGQAAGTLAALAVEQGKQPGDVGVRAVQNALLEHKVYIMPFMDMNADDTAFMAMQRMGAAGILKGFGVPYKWANQTWFYPDRMVSEYELKQGLLPYYPELETVAASGAEATLSFIKTLADLTGRPFYNPLTDSDNDEPLNRRLTSILIDQLFDPFSFAVDYEGNVLPKTPKE